MEGVPTAARIENGAIVEKEVGFDLRGMSSFRMALRNPDATTARRIARRVQDAGYAVRMLDPGTVEVGGFGKTGPAIAMAAIEQFRVRPDVAARVVVDSKSGTIVIGADVRISEVAISQGGLTVSVREGAQVSQPDPLTIGGTVIVAETEITTVRKESGFAQSWR